MFIRKGSSTPNTIIISSNVKPKNVDMWQAEKLNQAIQSKQITNKKQFVFL